MVSRICSTTLHPHEKHVLQTDVSMRVCAVALEKFLIDPPQKNILCIHDKNAPAIAARNRYAESAPSQQLPRQLFGPAPDFAEAQTSANFPVTASRAIL